MSKRLGLGLVVLAGLCTWQGVAGTSRAQDKKEEPKTITTESGLKYQDLKVGEGKEAKKGDMVEAHYTGWLTNGKKFDSSHDRGKPLTFTLKSGPGGVIAGWVEGVAGMKEGGKRKLMIPSKLAYGNQDVGNGLIPANSDLVFEVELIKVK